MPFLFHNQDNLQQPIYSRHNLRVAHDGIWMRPQQVCHSMSLRAFDTTILPKDPSNNCAQSSGTQAG